MAFQQPTRHVSQRVIRVDPISSESEARVAAPPPLAQSHESQTWVLFSPATDAGTSTSYLSSVQDDQPTPGRSRISDIGSLQTIAYSDNLCSEPANSDIIEEEEEDAAAAEDDAELDSLDSHLPEFRQQAGPVQSTQILPGHDGLGSFRLDTQGLSTDMQEQMYQFERYNPRRVKRRRESLELGQLALEYEEAQEAARRNRIEEWRLEQSRILLQEIQKETRRRRESTVSALTNRLRRGSSQVFADPEAEEATMSSASVPTPDASIAGTEWHDQDTSESALGAGESSETGMWSRITRKVIRDLMGIDDKLLCVLFGEALPDELGLDADDLSSTPKASAPISALGAAEPESPWQLRILDRIARELGTLVNQLSSHPHPGAFATYARIQQQPLPYAGLPVIPEVAPATAAATPMNLDTEDTAGLQNRAASSSNAETNVLPAVPQFQPTLQTIPHTRPVDIPGARNNNADSHAAGSGLESSHIPGTFTQQEWEQDLDIKLVFRYLRNRFTSRAASTTPSQPYAPVSPDIAAARAAARVRQHHPLIHQRRKSFKVSGGPSVPGQVVHGSCASQSTRRSGRRGSLSVSSSRHSSRHYWDIGAGGGPGSIGTGSLIASTGPMGSWGEV